MQSAIVWFGGKGRLVNKLIPLLPPHHTYVEPFGGGASLLHAKAPSPIEVYNDLDSGLVNFWRVLRDPEGFERFYHTITLTPYSRQEFLEAFDTWQETTDPVERAVRWYVVARQSFSGEHARRSWSYCRTESAAGMSRSTLRWLSAIDKLPEIHVRWAPVQIENDDFRTILTRYDTTRTLYYCDPPYVPDTRKSGGYRCEMTLADHEDLVKLLLGLEAMCILSGYAHPIYQPLESAGWRRLDFRTKASAAGRTRKTKLLGSGATEASQGRVESVWISPNVDTGQLRFEWE